MCVCVCECVFLSFYLELLGGSPHLASDNPHCWRWWFKDLEPRIWIHHWIVGLYVWATWSKHQRVIIVQIVYSLSFYFDIISDIQSWYCNFKPELFNMVSLLNSCLGPQMGEIMKRGGRGQTVSVSPGKCLFSGRIIK